MPTMEAGKGEHHVYRIREGQTDGESLQPGVHYLGIDAVAWFINRSSSWFNDRMASGTLAMQLANGREEYQAALGTFELDGGARYAPVFQKPVLPDRNYRGGGIILNAALSGVKRDTVLSGILKSAADASLGIVAGMIETATVAGPQKILGAAGASLVGSVKDTLQNRADKREAMFDFSGLQYGVSADELTTPTTFLLLHRGSQLDEDRLAVDSQGALLIPFYDDVPLADGAWLLLRLRRSKEYSGNRAWFADQSRFVKRVNDLVNDVDLGAVDPQEAREQLRPSDRGDSTLYDEYARLRTVINADGVITDAQAGVFKAQMTKTLKDAKKAIEAGSPAAYVKDAEELRGAVRVGDLTADFRDIVTQEIQQVSRNRAGDDAGGRTLRIDSEKMIQTVDLDRLVSDMPMTFDMGVAQL